MTTASVDVITLVIDEKDVSGRAGQTILEVARENDIEIPTLCHIEGLGDVGACRLCLVEIKGTNKLLPACVATIHEDMEVSTVTERLKKHRREIEGAHIWDVMGRGIDCMVITDLHEDWGKSACTRCGKCVQVCPTGALFDKSKIGSDHPKYPDFLPYLNLMREAQ